MHVHSRLQHKRHNSAILFHQPGKPSAFLPLPITYSHLCALLSDPDDLFIQMGETGA